VINQPLSEQYRLAALAWIDADSAASILEETKSIIFSEMVGKILEESPKLSVNRAENIVKSSADYKDFVNKMVLARTHADKLKVEVEYIRMKASEQMSAEATARKEMSL
jgi:hypothetical protein